MNWNEHWKAVEDAETTMSQARTFVRVLIKHAKGRLRDSSDGTWEYRQAMVAMKKELQKFNSTTGKWKD